MKKSTKTSEGRSPAKSARSCYVALVVSALLVTGVVSAVANYDSRANDSKSRAASPQAAANYVPIKVGARKLQVNAQALQQGPLTQEQAQQLAEALKDNKSTDGLVQVQNADGAVEMNLQGRFQNVAVAKKNDDGSVSQACVDNPQAASAFLKSTGAPTDSGSGELRKAVVKE
jgi:hypothetical protein